MRIPGTVSHRGVGTTLVAVSANSRNPESRRIKGDEIPWTDGGHFHALQLVKRGHRLDEAPDGVFGCTIQGTPDRSTYSRDRGDQTYDTLLVLTQESSDGQSSKLDGVVGIDVDTRVVGRLSVLPETGP